MHTFFEYLCAVRKVKVKKEQNCNCCTKIKKDGKFIMRKNRISVKKTKIKNRHKKTKLGNINIEAGN